MSLPSGNWERDHQINIHNTLATSSVRCDYMVVKENTNKW